MMKILEKLFGMSEEAKREKAEQKLLIQVQAEKIRKFQEICNFLDDDGSCALGSGADYTWYCAFEKCRFNRSPENFGWMELAMEFGFKANEKGWNLEKAREEFSRMFKEDENVVE